MNRKTKVVLASMMVITIGSVYAAILIQRQVNTRLRIERSVAMEVFDVDASTALTYLDFGDFTWGTNFFYPGKTTTEPSQAYYVNNTDQMDFYVMAQMPSSDPNVIFQIRFRRLDLSWSEWGDATQKIYPYPLISRVNNPDPNLHALQWQLRIWVTTGAPFGEMLTTLTFSAVSTPEG